MKTFKELQEELRRLGRKSFTFVLGKSSKITVPKQKDNKPKKPVRIRFNSGETDMDKPQT